jgi:HD superfamily phosphodiesterase
LPAEEEGAVNPFPSRLRWFAALVFISASAGIVALIAREGWPPGWPLLLFGSLVVFSEHRSVQLPNGVSLSASFMVTMAVVVVFADAHSLAGPMIVGLMTGVYLPQRKRGYRGWIAYNGGVLSLAVLASALCYRALPSGLVSHPPLALVGAVVAGLAFFATVWTFFAVSFAVEGQSPRQVIPELLPGSVQMLFLSMLGLSLGRLYLSLGPVVMVLIIVPIVIAREMFSSYMRVKESHDETVQLLIRALEQKDPYTAGHAGRVAVYAGYIGEELDFMPARMERLRFAALMHDIGKLVVPNQLLNKPGKLTEEEFARVRIHESVSVQMLSHIDFLRPIALHAHSDAMKFDPDNPDHPIEPYIIMVADAYDAMTSTRSYRKALPQEVAFDELRDKSGKQFHPACAEALIRAIEKRNEIHGKGHEEDSHFEDAPEVGLGSAGLGDLLPDDKAKK